MRALRGEESMAKINISTPIKEEEIRRLMIDDQVYLTGTMITARDMAHQRALRYLSEGKTLPISFEDLAVYHCGPVVEKNDEWRVLAAGPTTSMRMESMEAKFIHAFKPRIIVGKGGMGAKTAKALKDLPGVYCVFTGGAAVLAAAAVKKVKDVVWLDLGAAEALWVLEVGEFGPLTVSIDSHGNNLHEKLAKEVEDRRADVYKALGLK
jgi:fumarate hydratase subunit beta